MTNYNDGNWHGWNGGECPVHPKTEVETVLLDGTAPIRATADMRQWEHVGDKSDIIAFRVVKEYREPREFYLNIHNMHAVTKHDHLACGEGWITVREFLD